MSTDHRQTEPGPLIFISAAEPSADLHGANLIGATLAQCPSARFVGVAGPRMVAAGCEQIFDMTRHSAMLLGAIRVVGRGIRMLNVSDRHLRRYPFDAAVVIDSPTLHLPLAAKAHAAGVPVMYYIAPQLWAWGAYRVHKLRNRVDRVAVILPFEEKFFRDQGVNARFVGHPLAEHCLASPLCEETIREMRSAGSPLIALLPGSRAHVVESILPGQLEVARAISAAMPDARFGISVANSTVVPAFNRALQEQPVERGFIAAGQGASAVDGARRTFPGHHAELIRAADLALVASGTSTLEIAFHRTPMIVMYNASRLFYHLIGRWMIHTPHLSLPNILAGREIVPEFMPYYASTAPIARRAIDLLQSPEARESMIRDLAEVVSPLKDTLASQRTAEWLLGMAGASQR